MHINRIIILCLILYLLNGCAARSFPIASLDRQTYETKKTFFTPTDTSSTPKTSTDKNIPKLLIKDTKGVIVLSDEYGKNDFVRIYDADGTLWYKYTYYYDDSDGKFEYENNNFSPLAFHPDYFLLAFKCTGEDKKRYEVIVNEETGLKKFINKNDIVFEFKTWQQHILNVFSVDFDGDKNPLREKPAGKLIKNEFPAEVNFHPIRIKGDWLQVKWDTKSNSDNASQKTETGWIKWREEETLLIELFYLS